ncbi:Rrf2 family transcriptional regulator, partial [Streptococcus sp. DD11]
ITVARGTGGAEISCDLKDIRLLDVYQAVESLGKSGRLFSFHENPNPSCPIGSNIHNVLDDKLDEIQAAMEKELTKTSLADVVASAQKKIAKQSVS